MANKKPTTARPARVVEKEDKTFTATKRESGFLWKPSVFAEGRGNRLLLGAVYIELNRGVEFKPRAFCANFKGHGWGADKMLPDGTGPAILDPEELIEELESRADDRSKPEVIRYEDRPRPVAQIALEGELADMRERYAQLEGIFEQAAQKDPELLELRKKVLAEA